jgi:hypothetical protein
MNFILRYTGTEYFKIKLKTKQHSNDYTEKVGVQGEQLLTVSQRRTIRDC